MKANNSIWRTYRWYILTLAALAAISFDFALTKIEVVDGTFRPESEFPEYHYPDTKVSIVASDYEALQNPLSRAINPEYNQVEDMVRKAIELQGGLENIVKEGDVVMLKINLVGANSASGNGENTDVRVVKAIMKVIYDFTGGDVEFWIAEGSARSNDDVNSSNSVWANSGYRDLLNDHDLTGINFKLLNINQGIDDIVEFDLAEASVNAHQGSKYFIHQSVFDADVYIAVPVLKVHNTGITGALKLQIGIAPGAVYGYNKMKGSQYSSPLYHDIQHRRWTSEAIVDLSNIAQIDYVIVDALMCLELQKSDKENNRVRFNTILAGSDPVAIDHVCTRLFDMNPDDIAHITLAEKAGLGTNDPAKIEVTGQSIEQVKKRIRRNQESNGLFGQSNRTWILSEAFECTNIDDELLENEATACPAPGQNRWSEAMYFFDDRIDLLSYYNDKTNIVTYAYTNVEAPSAQKAELWLGSHEAIKVFLNGETVYESDATNSYGSSDIGKKVTSIQLNEGKNTLMVKTLNKFGDYSFALNICETETNKYYAGNRVKELRFTQNEKQTNIPALSELPSFSVYPNPASNFVYFALDVPTSNQYSISVFNLKGQMVKSFTNTDTNNREIISWNLTDHKGQQLEKGIYICTFEHKGEQQSVRLMVK